MENKELNESLKRYRELLGYDLEKGKRSLTERNHKPYLMEADPETGNKEGEDNADFDFGDEGDSKDKEGDKGGFDFEDAGGEDTGGDDNAGFDFGDDQGGDNADFDFGDEAGAEEDTEEVDEFGTADEFSAADDIEMEDGDTEEIDVTDIVKRADDAKGSAEKAVVAAEEGKNMIKDLMAKFQNLEASLSKIDNVSSEISSIKQDLQMQKPKEKLELRSLDSYPFNVKLTDYWNDVASKGNYEITDGSTPDGVSADGQVKVWDITPEDTKTYNATDIQKSFIPESKLKKKVLNENEQTSLELGDETDDKEYVKSVINNISDVDKKQEVIDQLINSLIDDGFLNLKDVRRVRTHQDAINFINNEIDNMDNEELSQFRKTVKLFVPFGVTDTIDRKNRQEKYSDSYWKNKRNEKQLNLGFNESRKIKRNK